MFVTFITIIIIRHFCLFMHFIANLFIKKGIDEMRTTTETSCPFCEMCFPSSVLHFVTSIKFQSFQVQILPRESIFFSYFLFFPKNWPFSCNSKHILLKKFLVWVSFESFICKRKFEIVEFLPCKICKRLFPYHLLNPHFHFWPFLQPWVVYSSKLL